MRSALHTLHLIAAGGWFGGVFFTSTVVTPALRTLYPDEAERVRVRSVIGRRFASVGGANLAALLLLALAEGRQADLDRDAIAEIALLLGIGGVAAAHGAYFGPRLARLADAEQAASSFASAQEFARQRRATQAFSWRLSALNGLMSLGVLALAARPPAR